MIFKIFVIALFSEMRFRAIFSLRVLNYISQSPFEI